jgi:hypothetical protein
MKRRKRVTRKSDLKLSHELQRTDVTEMQPHLEGGRLAFYSRLTQDLRKQQTAMGIRDGKADSPSARPVVVG